MIIGMNLKNVVIFVTGKWRDINTFFPFIMGLMFIRLVYYIQMQLFHTQHELIYEGEREKGNGTTNKKRRTQKSIERKKDSMFVN